MSSQNLVVGYAASLSNESSIPGGSPGSNLDVPGKKDERFRFSHFEARVSPEDGLKIAKAYEKILDSASAMEENFNALLRSIEEIRLLIFSSKDPQPSPKE